MVMMNITGKNKKNRVTGKDYISIKEECKVFISLFCLPKKVTKKGTPLLFYTISAFGRSDSEHNSLRSGSALRFSKLTSA